jgi:hypothetical protein
MSMPYDFNGLTVSYMYWNILGSLNNYTFSMAAAFWNNVNQQASSHIFINMLNIDKLVKYLCWLI